MRYEELPGPLEGWTYDEEGTIYTATGYRCSAKQIEFCLWMLNVMSSEAKLWKIHSDEHPGATRPLYEIADLKSGFQGSIGPEERETQKVAKGRNAPNQLPGWLRNAPSSRSGASRQKRQRWPEITCSGAR